MVEVIEAGVSREVPHEDRVFIGIDIANSWPEDNIWTYWQFEGVTNDTGREWLACDSYLMRDTENDEIVIKGNQHTHGHGDNVEIRIPKEIVDWGWGNLGPQEKYEDEYIEQSGFNPYEDDFDSEVLPEYESTWSEGERYFGILVDKDVSTVTIKGSHISFEEAHIIMVNEEEREAVVNTDDGGIRLDLDTGEVGDSLELEMVMNDDGDEVYVGSVEHLGVVK